MGRAAKLPAGVPSAAAALAGDPLQAMGEEAVQASVEADRASMA